MSYGGASHIGVYITGIHVMVLYLMDVHLIDAYFMDVYIPVPYLTNGDAVVDLSRSSWKIRVFALRDKRSLSAAANRP